jgi:hypothetical protein
MPPTKAQMITQGVLTFLGLIVVVTVLYFVAVYLGIIAPATDDTVAIPDDAPVVELEATYNFISGPAAIDLTDAITRVNQNMGTDVEVHAAERAAMPSAYPVLWAFEGADGISGVRYGPYSYRELYNNNFYPTVAEFTRLVEADLLNLVDYHTRESGIVSPNERNDEQVITVMNDEDFTFPPERVVRAQMAAEIFSLLDPVNEAVYRNAPQAYEDRGIAYGAYLTSDVFAAYDLVDTYFTELEATPVYEEWVTTMRAEFGSAN